VIRVFLVRQIMNDLFNKCDLTRTLKRWHRVAVSLLIGMHARQEQLLSCYCAGVNKAWPHLARLALARRNELDTN
jgi:hypothetical protein